MALPSKDVVRPGGVLTRVLERSKAARAGLEKDIVFQFGEVVGEAETVEHGRGVKDSLAYFCMYH